MKLHLLAFVAIVGPYGTDGDGDAVVVIVTAAGALAKTCDVATMD